MAEWLIFVLVAWFAVKFLKRSRHRRRIAERNRARVTEAEKARAVQAPAETEEERLRRRYVAGELSVEQYEQGLDALYRGNGGG